MIWAPGQAVRSTPQRHSYIENYKQKYWALYGVLASILGATQKRMLQSGKVLVYNNQHFIKFQHAQHLKIFNYSAIAEYASALNFSTTSPCVPPCN